MSALPMHRECPGAGSHILNVRIIELLLSSPPGQCYINYVSFVLFASHLSQRHPLNRNSWDGGGVVSPPPRGLSASDHPIVNDLRYLDYWCSHSIQFPRSVSFPHCKPVLTKSKYLDGNQCRDRGSGYSDWSNMMPSHHDGIRAAQNRTNNS